MNISLELRKEIDTVFKKFEFFRRKLKNNPYGYKQKVFFSIMEELHSYLASFENEELCELIRHSERYEEYEKFFRHQNAYFLRAIETVEALDIISQKVGINSSLQELISEGFLKKLYLQKGEELKLLNFEDVKKIIFVGSGPFPHTSLHVYENTNIPEIMCLDYNEEAIYISSRFIENLGFSDRIHLRCIDGREYDYQDADIIYISAFVTPKHEVLDQIVKTSTNPDLQILVDSTSGMKKVLFEEINDTNLNKRLKIKGRDSRKTDTYRWEMIKLEKYNI